MTAMEDHTNANQNEQDAAPLSSAQSVAEALDEIDRILHQMLLLAELSASDISTDRDRLQRTLERLQAKIDHIADGLETEQL